MPNADFASLREKAVGFVAIQGAVSDEELLAHVYGSVPPSGARSALLAPFAVSADLIRDAEGRWRLAERQSQASMELVGLRFAALVVVPTGGRPGRNRVAGLEAISHEGTRFSTRLNPDQQIPPSVAQRLRIDTSEQHLLPPFGEVAASLTDLLGDAPIVVQEPELARAFLQAEFRLAGQTLPPVTLVGLERLADLTLGVSEKPTLQTIATRCGIGSPSRLPPEVECRVVAQVAATLFALAAQQGLSTLGDLLSAMGSVESTATRPLADLALPSTLAEGPGVYVMRGADNSALYVGKASQLRERVAAYVARPLGVTRRLEGLAESVASVRVESTETDLEALVRETQEIERLQPRFNTVRANRAPRLWLTLPNPPPPPSGKRKARRRAPPRMLLAESPGEDARNLGPWRNTLAAESARDLARGLFDLDLARRGPLDAYVIALESAWAFLGGEAEEGIARAQALLADATAARDHAAQRRAKTLLRQALDYDPATQWLPADPRHARYAVVRPRPDGVEGLVIDRGLLVARAFSPWHLTSPDFAAALLAEHAPRTGEADATIVLRWLGWQRSPARLIHLNGQDEATSLDAAHHDLFAARAATLEAFAEDDR